MRTDAGAGEYDGFCTTLGGAADPTLGSIVMASTAAVESKEVVVGFGSFASTAIRL